MDGRAFERMEEKSFTSPHLEFSSYFNKRVNQLMRLTYDYPEEMKKAPYVSGGISVALMLSAFVPTRIPRPIQAGCFIFGAAGAFASLTTSLLQNKVFGFPNDNSSVYRNDSFTYNSAHAELLVDDAHFPRLNIKSTHYYEAGYVEGYILGDAIRANLNAVAINFLFKLVYTVTGFPDTEKFNAYFTDIISTIPKRYQNEMRGKVDGYNAWLQATNKKDKPLEIAQYVLFQVIPDYQNHNPFADCRFAPLLQNIGCTSFALRVGDVTFFSRILDWLAYDRSSYFIEVQKQIAETQTITDIAHPLLSGALTVMNSSMLFQMNVAHGPKVEKPEGMPAVFFNRYCAEESKDFNELEDLLSRKKPLGAYHLTVSGKKTKSFHFFQNLEDPSKHVIEELNPDKNIPQLLVVANNGIQQKEGKNVPFNFRDSDERKANLQAFFNHHKDKFQSYIDKQKNGNQLSLEDLNVLTDMVLNMARLPLVSNCASVFFGVYRFVLGELQEAYAVTDNSFAPAKPFTQFKQLRR